jgi:hypothetical protein
MAGKSYKVKFSASNLNWTVTGYNEGKKGDYTGAYTTQSPSDYKLNLWGRVYAFKSNGEVYDMNFGLVGHLGKTENPQIVFPIVELGNCKSEADCKTYCAKEENMLACAEYGAKHGLTSQDELQRAREFADVLRGEGPGACKDKATCEAYCEDISHINECLAFAEKHGFVKAEQLAEAKKVAMALKNGAVLPGGCKDKDTCDAYCKDMSHVDECFAFAKKAGFISEEEAVEAEKMLPLVKAGQTPGQCKTKEDCRLYCEDAKNSDECVSFALKAGLVSEEEAEMIKKTGGKGPGGCKSKETCDAYCNKAENREECFEFAQKHGLIPPEKLKEMEEGMGRLRAGLSQMPSEAIKCLKDKLGENVISEIESGNFTPGPDTGEIIKGCFDEVLPQLQAKLQAGIGQATPETLECLKNGLGQSAFVKIKSGEAPDPENGDVIRKCFESMKQDGLKKIREGLAKMPPEMKACITQKIDAGVLAKIEKGEDADIGPEAGAVFENCAKEFEVKMMEKMKQGLDQAPPEVRTCVETKLGNVAEKIRNGEMNESDIQAVINGCAENFKPQGAPGGAGVSGAMPPAGDMPGAGAGAPPPDFAPGPDICSKFEAAPSCSYVPESAREMCKKCFPNK